MLFPTKLIRIKGAKGREDRYTILSEMALTSLRYIQELLGHKDSKTTEIYTHVSTKSIGKIGSPLPFK